MLSHNLLLIWRNFKRYKLDFTVNLIGLSSGLAAALLVYLWAVDELGFDKFHENDSRLFQVMENEKTVNGIKTKTGTAQFLSDALENEMPEIESSVVVTPADFFPKFTLTANEHSTQSTCRFAGKNFFRLFSYNLLGGNVNQVLAEKDAIVISEQLAKNLFASTESVVGKTIDWKAMGLHQTVTITGIFKNVPANSTEQFDFVLSFDAFRDIMQMGSTVDWEGSGPFNTYVLLKDRVNQDLFNRKLSTLISDKGANSQHRSLFIRSYSDNYLFGKYENGIQSGGRIEYVKLFSALAFLILAIACINFMNLFTARASRRVKEVGIKKVMGISRSRLIAQYLVESMVLAVTSLCVALLFVNLILPQFNEISGKELSLGFDMKLVTGISLITFLTGLFSGLYPAIYLSSFNPAQVLKGQFSNSGESWIRKGLVLFQFSVAVIFIVSVMVVHNQLEFLQTKELGYIKDNVLYFEATGKVNETTDFFLSEIKQIPGVMNASSMWGGLFAGTEFSGAVQWNGKKIPIQSTTVNFGLLETLGIELIEGRSFSKEIDLDTMKVILNQAAVDAMDLKDPIGKRMPGSGSEIIGVAKNFHFQSLHEQIRPFMFRLEPYYAMTIIVRIKPGVEKETIPLIKEMHAKFNPGLPFDYHFLDQQYESQYVAEKRVEVLSTWFSLLAIIISSLGLVGLVRFIAAKRTKEIGIRKVLGSTEYAIVRLLSVDFMQIIFAAVLVALPASYFLNKYWLDGFAFRIELEWWYFALACFATITFSWITVVGQVLKAARTNPSQSLKND